MNIPLPVLVNPAGDMPSLPFRDVGFGSQTMAAGGLPVEPFDAVSSSDAARYLGLDYFPSELRQSSVGDYLRCRRYFMLRHRFKLTTKGIFLPHAPTRGTLFHLFMSGYYSGKTEDESVAAAGEWLDDLIDTAAKLVEEGHPSVSPDSLDSLSEDCEKLVALARVMFRVYVTFYPRQDYEKVLLVEQNIKVRQKGIPVAMGGILDKLFEDTRTDGEVWIRDYKSVSRSPLQRVKTVSYDVQQMMYRILATAYLKEHHPTKRLVGMIHSVIEEPGIEFGREDRNFKMVKKTFTRGPRKGQTIEEKEFDGPPVYENYLKRVTDWYKSEGKYADKKDRRQTNPAIVQSYYRFDGPLIPAEFHTLLHEAGKACRAKPKLARFYRNRDSCFDYQRPCEYLGLCGTDPTLWRDEVKKLYTQIKE